jgi:RNA polymerase sigma factor (sigma-70 family)
LQKDEVVKAFEQKIKQHEMLIHKVCSLYAWEKSDRQDLFQEIVLQLWKAFPKFKGDSKFSTWLYRVALNTAITGLRKQRNFIDYYEPTTLPQHYDDSASSMEEEQFKLLYKAIDQLNEIERAITMLYMEDKPYEEMEEILGISQGHLRVKMNRIKEKLRQLTKTH